MLVRSLCTLVLMMASSAGAAIICDADGASYGELISDSFSDVTLSAVGSAADGEVYACTDAFRASTGSNVFAWSSGGTIYPQWSDNVGLRADFAYPVHQVSIDIIGNNGGDYGILEAYDVSGTLLSERLSPVLTDGEVFTAEIVRPSADIAYVIARGRIEEGVHQTVHLDNLTAVPEPGTLGLLLLGGLGLIRRSRGR